jgi:hypothetical protein
MSSGCGGVSQYDRFECATPSRVDASPCFADSELELFESCNMDKLHCIHSRGERICGRTDTMPTNIGAFADATRKKSPTHKIGF